MLYSDELLASILACPAQAAIAFPIRFAKQSEDRIQRFIPKGSYWFPYRFRLSLERLALSLALRRYLGDALTPSLVKEIWGNIWGGPSTKAQWLNANSTLAAWWRYRLVQGLQIGLKLADRLTNIPGRVLLVAERYRIPLGEHVLSGIIHLAYEDEKHGLTVIRFQAFQHSAAKLVSRNWFLVTSAVAAGKLLGKPTKRILLYSLTDNVSLFAAPFQAEEQEQDLRLALRYAAALEERGDFPPAYSEQCRSCPYIRQCLYKHWRKDPNKLKRSAYRKDGYLRSQRPV